MARGEQPFVPQTQSPLQTFANDENMAGRSGLFVARGGVS